MNRNFSDEKTDTKLTNYDELAVLTNDDVYEPHEDSFLLADAATKEAFGDVLDLGCGTGLAGISAALNGKTKSLTFADISEKSLELAKKNTQTNHVAIPTKFLQTDLFSNIPGKLDCILFNPPYLPTAREEKLEGKINLAFDGGSDGRKILDSFLQEFPAHLKPKGILLLLNSSVSSSGGGDGNAETIEKLEKLGFQTQVAGRQKFFFEELMAITARKQRN